MMMDQTMCNKVSYFPIHPSMQLHPTGSHRNYYSAHMQRALLQLQSGIFERRTARHTARRGYFHGLHDDIVAK